MGALPRIGLVLGVMLLAAAVVATWLLQSPRRDPAGVAQGARAERVALAAFFVVACGAGFLRHQAALQRPANHVAPLLGREPVLTRVMGRIVTTPIERPVTRRNPYVPFQPRARTRFVLALETLRTDTTPTPITGQLLVRVDESGLAGRLGDPVEIVGYAYALRGPRNPGEPDWAALQRRSGVDGAMRVTSTRHIRRLPAPRGWWPAAADAARSHAQAMLHEPWVDADTSEGARLLDVLVLGQRSAADRQLNDAFRRAGGLHFLSVSGFHVAALAGFVWWLVRRIGRAGRRWGAAVVIVVTLAYALVAEPNAPILRATIGIVAASLAALTGRRGAALNWLALAAIGILLVSPHELFGPGFQLSFVMVAALMTVVPRVDAWLRGRMADGSAAGEAMTLRELVRRVSCRALVGALTVSVVCWSASLPLVMHHFGTVAPWGWFGSILLAPWVALTVVLSFATLALGGIPGLAEWTGSLLQNATTGLHWLVERVGSLPAALLDVPQPPGWLVALTYLLAVAISAATRQAALPPKDDASARPRRRRISPLVASAGVLGVLTWAAWLAWPTADPGTPRVVVLDVGAGTAGVLCSPDGRAAVLDCGTRDNFDAGETALLALRRLGCGQLDGAVLTGLGAGSFSGLPTLARRARLPRWWTLQDPSDLPPARRTSLFEALPADVRVPTLLAAGSRLTLAGGVLDVLANEPGSPAGREGGRTTLVRWSAAGQRVLFVASAGNTALREALARARATQPDLGADVLVIRSAGALSAAAARLLADVVMPRVVVVCGRDVPDRWSGVAWNRGGDVTVLATGEVGAVSIELAAREGPRVSRGGW